MAKGAPFRMLLSQYLGDYLTIDVHSSNGNDKMIPCIQRCMDIFNRQAEHA